MTLAKHDSDIKIKVSQSFVARFCAGERLQDHWYSG